MTPEQTARWDELSDQLQAAYDAETGEMENWPAYRTWSEAIQADPSHPLHAAAVECEALDHLDMYGDEWRLVQNSTGRVIRSFENEEEAWFYQHHDSLYPVSEYTVCAPEEVEESEDA
jgi:hypothetical protein